MRTLGSFLGDVWRLTRPYYFSEQKWSARGLLAVNLAMRLALVGGDVLLNFWNNAFFNTLQEKDFSSFLALLLTWKVMPSGWIMPGFVVIVVIYIVISVYRTWLVELLQIRWRRWLTGRFLDGWLGERTYYRISLQSSPDAGGISTDNPDQRISEDLRAFVGDGVAGVQGVLFFAIDLLSNVVSLFSFIAILWSLSGPFGLLGIQIPGYMVWVALLYAVIGTVLTHLVGRPLVLLSFVKQRVEANFRFALMRIRENLEGVALSRGEDREMHGLRERFEALARNWRQLMQRTKYLNALNAAYAQIAGIFPFVVAAPRFFSGALPLGGLTQTADAFGQVQGALSWLVNNYQGLADFRATVDRLNTFHAAIEAARAASLRDATASGPAGSAFTLRDSTIALPNGEALLSHADLTLRPGESTVITGRSGSGKSTLFRVLAGIWPFGGSNVQRPTGSYMFLPQRPYIPLGTLRNALAYPNAPEHYQEAATLAALEDCGLGHLADRLDEEAAWQQRLSGGEMQRLAIGRALLAAPEWLFLDEATANLDPEAEAAVYAMLRRRLPGTTIVSIAHRPAVAAAHDRTLRLEQPPGRIVEAKPIVQETASRTVL